MSRGTTAAWSLAPGRRRHRSRSHTSTYTTENEAWVVDVVHHHQQFVGEAWIGVGSPRESSPSRSPPARRNRRIGHEDAEAIAAERRARRSSRRRRDGWSGSKPPKLIDADAPASRRQKQPLHARGAGELLVEAVAAARAARARDAGATGGRRRAPALLRPGSAWRCSRPRRARGPRVSSSSWERAVMKYTTGMGLVERIGLELDQQLVAVHAREHHVEQHQVRVAPASRSRARSARPWPTRMRWPLPCSVRTRTCRLVALSSTARYG